MAITTPFQTPIPPPKNGNSMILVKSVLDANKYCITAKKVT
jgi:hypothetical protein